MHDDWELCGGGYDDWCDCGGLDCTCGYEVDCINGIDNYMPCGGASSCGCGGTACTCSDYCSEGEPACGGEPCEEFPEFPLGIELMIALAPAIPIVYLWRTRKNKSKATTLQTNLKRLRK